MPGFTNWPQRRDRMGDDHSCTSAEMRGVLRMRFSPQVKCRRCKRNAARQSHAWASGYNHLSTCGLRASNRLCHCAWSQPHTPSVHQPLYRRAYENLLITRRALILQRTQLLSSVSAAPDSMPCLRVRALRHHRHWSNLLACHHGLRPCAVRVAVRRNTPQLQPERPGYCIYLDILPQSLPVRPALGP